MWFTISTELKACFILIAIHWFMCRYFWTLKFFRLGKILGGGGAIAPPPAPPPLSPPPVPTAMSHTHNWHTLSISSPFLPSTSVGPLCSALAWFPSWSAWSWSIRSWLWSIRSWSWSIRSWSWSIRTWSYMRFASVLQLNIFITFTYIFIHEKLKPCVLYQHMLKYSMIMEFWT